MTFSDFSRDSDGTEHFAISVAGDAFRGSLRTSFHPGESSLVEFFRGALETPPTYRDDRSWGARRGLVFRLGRHDDDGRLCITASLSPSESEIGSYWQPDALVLVSPEQVRQFADDLTDLFGYNRLI